MSEDNKLKEDIKSKDYTVKIKLDYSIPIKTENGSSVNCDELTLHRLQGKHLRSLPDKCFKDGRLHPTAVVNLIAASAQIPLEAADEIDMRDLDEIGEKLLPFLPSSL